MVTLPTKVGGYKATITFGFRSVHIQLPCKCEIVFDPQYDPEKPWSVWFASSCPHYETPRCRTVDSFEDALNLLLPLLPAILEPRRKR
jgi:hypothetical protein